MKKLLVIMMAVALIAFGTNAMAFGSGVSATINPVAGGGSSDNAQMTSIFGWGDDQAWASGGSGGDSENYGEANLYGWGKAGAEGQANASGDSHAGALAVDLIFIPISFTAAGAQTTVSVDASGRSGFIGFGIGNAYNESKGTVEGGVNQGQYANEIHGNTFSQASNESGAEFYGVTKDTDSQPFGIFIGGADSSIRMTGDAETHGTSFVTVDPYGDDQSAYAVTENSGQANVVGDDFEINKVSGNGSVNIGASSQNQSSGGYAGGSGTFNYNSISLSGTNGSGQTEMTAESHVGNNSFNSSASGSSTAMTTP